jgi:hypothetical protein
VFVSAAVTSLPDVAFAPLQLPEAVQEVASVEVQVSVAVPLTLTVNGSALKLTVGAAGGGGLPATVTVTLRLLEPPEPVHCKVKLLLALSIAVCSLPEGGLFPAHAPEAAHPVALLLDQVSVERPPAATDVGSAEKFTTGAANRFTVTALCVVPPAPVHDKLKVVDADKGPTVWLPFGTVLLPLQPPFAVHPVALLVVQLRSEVPLSATEVGFADRLTVGAGVDPTVTVTDFDALPPPVLVHASVKLAVAASGPSA